MQFAAVNKHSGKASAVVYVPLNTVRETIDRYRQRESVGFGIVQIVLGIVCVVLNAVSLGILHYRGYGFIFHGVWFGALVIATGSLGILACNTKAKCKIVTYMLLCIISSSLAVAVILIGITGATCGHRYCLSSSLEHVIDACISASAIIEGIMGILSAVLCFKAEICCGQKRNDPESLQTKYALNGGHMMYFALDELTCTQVPHSSTKITSYSQQDAFDVGQQLPSDPPSYSASVEDN